MVAEVAVVDVTEEVPVSKRLDSIDQAIADFRDTLGEIAKGVSDALETFSKPLSSDTAEDVAVESVALSLSDEDVERIASVVAEKVIVSRKSAVYTADESDEKAPKPLDIKQLSVSELSNVIATRIAGRVNK